MSYYSKLIYQIKRKINNFVDLICSDLNKTQYKFVFQMIYGLMESQSVKLSDISRSLKENITLKKTIERLSRNLKSFDKSKKLLSNYIDSINKYINDDTVFCVDLSDVVKPNSTVLESLGRVRDGSTGKIEDGYNIFEIAALTKKHKMPLSVYSRIFSNAEKNFISENTETFNGLKYLTKTFGTKGIRALDRGFDNNKYYGYFIDKKEKFIIRSKKNRNVIYKGKKQNILTVAKKYKGKYKLPFKSQNGKSLNVKVSYIPIQLPEYPEQDLILVTVYGFGKTPMMLITNLKSNDKRISVTIVKVYLLRWRIEEYFKFKKQQFNFEDLRVQSLKSIRNLNLLLTIVIGFIGVLSVHQDDSIYIQEIFQCAKSIYGKAKFVYYQIADGIYDILQKSTTGIDYLIPKYNTKLSRQLTLHKWLNLRGLRQFII